MSHHKMCSECGADVIVVDDKFVPVKTKNSADLYAIPFKCQTCGGIRVGFAPTLDRVMVWSDPIPETYVEDGQIEIPIQYKEDKLSDLGVVVAFGLGYYDNKRFHPVADLYIGARVVYDKTVPWDIDAKGSDGEMHSIKIMGYADIKVVLEE